MDNLLERYYVYIALCSDGTYYTGYTTNISVRESEHNGTGKLPGAKYTRSRRPVRILYSEKFGTKSLAMRRETEIKKLDKQKKEQLISASNPQTPQR